MREITELKELQKIELEMLQEIDKNLQALPHTILPRWRYASWSGQTSGLYSMG